ncbi:MAG: class I SAM-dependent methyltransferase [Nakamurella sp.]
MAHQHMTEMLDLDVEVLQDHHREVIALAGALVHAQPHIIDLGAGTGAGTIALAQHLPGAHLTALDVDDEMLAHLRHRAGELAVAQRIRTVRADLDATWPAALGPADLIWASASMHHFADPAQTLERARAALRPGGAMMITELDSFPKFLTDPVGSAIEDRCHDEMARHRAAAGMHMHEDWGARLEAAGFERADERRFDIDLRPPLPAHALRYAVVCLSRMRERLGDSLDPQDLAALDDIVANLSEQDLRIRATRLVWIGRRP